MSNVLILGAGTWGVAIAKLLSNNGHKVTCWARNENLINELKEKHLHPKLPKVVLNEDIIFTNKFENLFEDKDVIVYAVPSTGFREVVHNSIKHIDDKKYLVSLTKGMEDKTLFTMSEIIYDELKEEGIVNEKVVVLSGPTHAEEVVRELPSMIVSASSNISSAEYIQDMFMNEYFRVYTNSDVKGVEICAAFKNVIALASGIVAGLGYGDNMKAALITRGLAEMIRVGEVVGCKKDTFYGLAGVGDMIVTATSTKSRNYNCGKLLGEGYKAKDAIARIGMVVEGINFLPKAMSIKNKYNLDLPITNGVNDIVYNNMDAKYIATLLMTRSKKAE